MEIIFESNKPGNYTQNLLADNYYEIFCVGAGGGGSYGAGGAGAFWHGVIKPNDDITLTLTIGNGGAGAIKYARNHCGTEGENSTIYGNGISIVSTGGYPGIAARVYNCKHQANYPHGYSPAPTISVEFEIGEEETSVFEKRQESWIPNETYGAGASGGEIYGIGESGRNGYIKIIHINGYVEYNKILKTSTYRTVVTNTTFKAESKLTSVNLNNRPVQDNSLEEAFLSCVRLETLSNSVDSVRNLDKAFYGCTSLKEVPQIPSLCTSMNATFQNCSKLNCQIEIPDGVTNIEDCFNGCRSLTIVPTFQTRTRETRFTSLKRTFKNTNIEETPLIADIDNTIEEAFMNCKHLTSVKLDSDLTSRSGILYSQDMTRAFYGCVNLTSIPYISTENLHETFYGCSKLSGIIVIKNDQVEDATDCFFSQNANTPDRNVYIPFGSHEHNTQTYGSFQQAGYSNEKRKHGVLLIPDDSSYVTFTLTSEGEKIQGAENASVTVTYNNGDYPCVTTISTHPNGSCPSGCAKNKFYAIIPNNTEYKLTVSLDKFEDKVIEHLMSPEKYTEQNIDVDLTRATSRLTITVQPTDSNVNLFSEEGMPIPLTPVQESGVNTGEYYYDHETGNILTLRYACTHTNLLPVSGVIYWNTNENLTQNVELNKPSYYPGEIIWESNVGGDSKEIPLYEDYIYELTCVGGGGGSSYGAGGAGATWIGQINVDQNNIVYANVGNRGNAAGAYCRNHCGTRGGTSSISNELIDIQSYGGYPGIAARSYNCSCGSGKDHSQSPAPFAHVTFNSSIKFVNTYQNRQKSYIDGTTYGQGANGGYNGKGIGGWGYPGYIKICYIDIMSNAGDDGGCATPDINTSVGGYTGTLNISAEKAGLYRITAVGGGGGCLYYTSPNNENVYYKASGGAGGGFKITVYLAEGSYPYAIGEAGVSSKAPSECTDGGDTIFGNITVHGGKKGYVELGVYTGGAGGEIEGLTYDPEETEPQQTPYVCYETVFNSIGENGSSDISSSATIKGGKSVYDGHGAGGGLDSSAVVNATSGYLKVARVLNTTSGS